MIWLIGSKGMLASEISTLVTQLNMKWIGTDKEVDITDKNALQEFYKATFQKKKCEWIINCAAYMAVDKAEDDSSMAQKLNADSLINISELAKKTVLNLFIFQQIMYLPVIRLSLIPKLIIPILKTYMEKPSWKVNGIL